MKYFLFLVLGWCHFAGALGQNKPLLYNVDDLPQTLMSNPGAQIAFSGHVGIPFLNQIHFSAGFTGVTVYDVFNEANQNVDLKVRDAIRKLTERDYFSLNEQVEILSMGWKIDKQNYLSAGVYQEMDVFIYFPKDLALLANEGNNAYINQPFHFDQFSLTGEIMTVYHLGLNHIVDNRLTVGARGKLYSGIFNVNSTGNTGVFTTISTPEGPNVYRHYVRDLDVLVNTAGFASVAEQEGMTVEEGTRDLLSRSFFGGNVGLGLDLGASYMVNEQFQVTAAVQDIGMMFQRSDVENYHYYGDYETSGLEPLFPEPVGNGQGIPYWEIFEDEVDENIIDETLQEPYVTWRPLKINTSLEYGFGREFLPCDYRTVTKLRYLSHVGLQLAGVSRPRGMVYSLTGYYDRKLGFNQRIRVAYTMDDYSLKNIGLMYSSTFKNFNVYLAVNNLFAFPDLAKANSASVQFGMQLIFEDL